MNELLDGKTKQKDHQKKRNNKGYNVIFYNDDVTPIEYVISLLIFYFEKNLKDATNLTINIQTEGMGVVGIYPEKEAYEKLELVRKNNEATGYELYCTVEENK